MGILFTGFVVAVETCRDLIYSYIWYQKRRINFFLYILSLEFRPDALRFE